MARRFLKTIREKRGNEMMSLFSVCIVGLTVSLMAKIAIVLWYAKRSRVIEKCLGSDNLGKAFGIFESLSVLFGGLALLMMFDGIVALAMLVALVF